MTDDQKTGNTPLDPTQDASELMGDTSGLTGITVNNTHSDSAQGTGSVSNTHTANGENQTTNPSTSSPRGISDQTASKAEDAASEDDVQDDATIPAPKGPNHSFGSTISDSSNTNLTADAPSGTEPYNTPPSVQGEQSVSGDMPDPESDDDTLANAQKVGMQPQEDTEHPQELDIARDVDQAEESLRSS